MIKKIFYIFGVIFLIYMVWPGPSSITQLNGLPDSAKSTLSGDTVEIPNVSGYFSNKFRNFVIPFYKNNYQQISHFPFPPLRLNHPPEYSWTAIKRQTETIYLEEFTYPLRDSLFVNGYEILRPNGSPIFYSAPRLEEAGKSWPTKVTLRLYTSNILARIIVWAGILISMKNLFRLGTRIIKE